MSKAALVIFADTGSHEGLGRVANALIAAKEFDERGDEVSLLFDGAGTKWVAELADAEHRYHGVFESLKEKGRVAGACAYCAAAFGVKSDVEASGVPLLDEYEQHPSIRGLVAEGYEVVTF
jgi:hypothetical protein